MNERALIIASIVLVLLGSSPLINSEIPAGSDPDERWIPYREYEEQIVVPPGDQRKITVLNDDIDVTQTWPQFSQTVEDAIAAAPPWLRKDLALKFDRMGEDDRDLYARLILNASNPEWIDEVAFVVAHSNVPTLTDQYFFPELIYDNARLIYETDPILKYVRIVEEDDYTTLAYMDGNNNERVLPRDIYYWFVVHPDIGDELPTYVDPDYNYTTDPPFDRNYGVAPPTGVFWRDHLLNYNKTGRPLLKDSLAGARNVREAIQAINGWVDRSMIFTSDQERPVQPVRIYEKGKGRCGEYQDMRSAAARIALIPVVAASNAAEDHVWNEFWDQRWVHWDGTVDNPLMYEKGWGKTISTVWDVRGDGLSWTVTERYSEGYSNLTVTVLDGSGLPADGVTVDLLTENYYNQDIKTTTASSSTTFDGTVRFTIGDGRNYWLRADGGSLGSTPVNPLTPIQAITGSEAGKDYNFTLRLPRSASALKATPSMMGNALPYVILEISFEVSEHTTFGTSSVSGGPYDGKGGSGSVDFFILDYNRMDLYSRGLPFDAYNLSLRTGAERIIFQPATTDIHYIVLSNEYSQSTYEIVNVTVRMFRLWDFDVDSPEPGAVFERGSRIEFKGTFYTPYEHRMVNVRVEGDESGSTQAVFDGPVWSCELDSYGLYPGLKNVLISVKDDSIGRSYGITITVEDTTAPSLYAAPIASAFKAGDPIPLSGSAFDLSGVSALSLTIDGSMPSPIYDRKTDGNWSYMLNTDGLSPGGHELIVTAADPFENTASIRLSTTIVEADPPELLLDPGIDGSLHAKGEVVRISGKATDASGVSLKFYIDSRPRDISSTVKDGAFSYEWDTRGELEGWCDLKLVASDPYGSTSEVDLRVLLDGTDPLLEILEFPEIAGPLSGIRLSGRASDAAGVRSVSCSVDGGFASTIHPNSGHFAFEIDDAGWRTGIHKVIVTASDEAGNTASIDLEVLYDGTAPEVAVDPVPTIVLIGDIVTATGTVSDDIGLSGALLSLDGIDNELSVPDDGGAFTWTFDTTGERPGDRRLTVTATDNVGNVEVQEVLFRLVDARTDTDGDGMPDWWEHEFGLDPDTDNGDLDSDGDGSSDLDEYLGDDGRPGNDDWSDPTDDSSEPARSRDGPFPFLVALIILASLSVMGSAVVYVAARSAKRY